VIQDFDVGPIKIMFIIDPVVGNKRPFFFLISAECSRILVFNWRFVWPTYVASQFRQNILYTTLL